MNKCFSVIEVKAADSESWTFTGVASTPSPDRMKDTVSPDGARYKLPIPLLWQHDHGSPIGHVNTATVTGEGIEIKAAITQPADGMPPGLTGRLQEAWSSIKSGLVRGLSIGFKPIEWEPIDNGGMNITVWDWLELSAVTIPANMDASIATIKQFSAPQPESITKSHSGFSLRSTHFHLRNT